MTDSCRREFDGFIRLTRREAEAEEKRASFSSCDCHVQYEKGSNTCILTAAVCLF